MTQQLQTVISGIVPPPRNRSVNRTMISVVVTSICRFSGSMSMCKLRAKAMAPLRPAAVEVIILGQHNTGTSI